MGPLTALQESALAQWVGGAETLLAYPTILTLHTVGMSVVIGTCLVLNLRLLGFGAGIPLESLRGIPRLVWGGFLVNAVTGALLFLPDAEHKATQTIFLVKLALIAVALVVYARIRQLVFARGTAHAAFIPPQARFLSMVSLIAWAGATVAGRLMAYIL